MGRSASTTTSTRARRSSATLSVLLTMALRARPRRTTITTTTTSLQLAKRCSGAYAKGRLLSTRKATRMRESARPHVHCTEPVRRAKCNDREGNSGVRCLDELHGSGIIGDAISKFKRYAFIDEDVMSRI